MTLVVGSSLIIVPTINMTDDFKYFKYKKKQSKDRNLYFVKVYYASSKKANSVSRASSLFENDNTDEF